MFTHNLNMFLYHNFFIALICDAPESKQKLKDRQTSDKFDTNEEVRWHLL